MERMLTDYQEKLESVTTNYDEKVRILEKRLVDNEMEQSPEKYMDSHSRRDSGGNAGICIKYLAQIKFIIFYMN